MINNFLETKAEKLLRDSNCYAAAIDIRCCAKFLNLNVEEIELESNVSGFLVLQNDKAVIGCNKNHSEERKRFTIAHELSHFVLHAKDSPLFVDKDRDPSQRMMFRDESSSTGEFIQEREANAFAAALLMPKKLVEEELQASSILNMQDAIKFLAKRFKVSVQAMSIRLANLDIIDYNA